MKQFKIGDIVRISQINAPPLYCVKSTRNKFNEFQEIKLEVLEGDDVTDDLGWVSAYSFVFATPVEIAQHRCRMEK